MILSALEVGSTAGGEKTYWLVALETWLMLLFRFGVGLSRQLFFVEAAPPYVASLIWSAFASRSADLCLPKRAPDSLPPDVNSPYFCLCWWCSGRTSALLRRLLWLGPSVEILLRTFLEYSRNSKKTLSRSSCSSSGTITSAPLDRLMLREGL